MLNLVLKHMFCSYMLFKHKASISKAVSKPDIYEMILVF